MSVGIVTSEGGYTSPEDMLRDADLAMYRAKDRGRARMEVFDAGMWTEAWGNLELETDLRRAVERDEFEMFFQPIVRLDDGSVYGFEALLRWHQPQRGLLMPAEFLELADDTGADRSGGVVGHPGRLSAAPRVVRFDGEGSGPRTGEPIGPSAGAR